MHSSSILPPLTRVETDGAMQTGSALGSRFRRTGLAIWRALEASGQARALRELRTLHGHWEIDQPAPVQPHR